MIVLRSMIFPMITEYEFKFPYYVAGVGCYHNQEHVIRPQGYPHFQWLQCHKGRGAITIEGATYNVSVGQGILLFPNTPHEYYAITDLWEVDWIIFGGLHVEDFFRSTAGIKKSGVYYISQPDVILKKIRKVLTIEQSNNSMKGLECSAIAYSILMDIFVSTSLKSEYSLDHQYNKLKPLFEYIDANYNKPFTLPELAEVVSLSPQYLCVLFKKATKLRVFEYINFLRIKKSKEHLLSNPELKIAEVAHLSGYDDVSYYCAIFKKIEQVSPTEFRKLHTYA